MQLGLALEALCVLDEAYVETRTQRSLSLSRIVRARWKQTHFGPEGLAERLAG